MGLARKICVTYTVDERESRFLFERVPRDPEAKEATLYSLTDVRMCSVTSKTRTSGVFDKKVGRIHFFDLNRFHEMEP